MIPDYSKPSLISISTEEGSISFTAPSNGYIIGSGFGDGQAKNFLYLHCGDVSIRQQGNSNENIGSIFPVKKGDIVGINFCFSQKNNGIYFVPTVWLNSKAQKYRKFVIERSRKIELQYSTYRTVSVICIGKSMYLYSNGYLTPIYEDISFANVSLSSDFKKITIENKRSGEELYGAIMYTDLIPTITFISE